MKTAVPARTLATTALAIGIAVSLAAWFVVGHQGERESRAQFAHQAGLAASLVERRIQRYVDLLYGLEATLSRPNQLSRSEFHNHVLALRAGQRFPGVQAMQFIRRVPAAERTAFVAGVRADRSLSPGGYPRFDIRTPGLSDEYWVIEYVEPLAGNEQAFGLDLRQLPVPRLAVERARDTGEPISTGRYRLAQESGSSYGLVIYMPIYGSGAAPASLADRRSEVRGWVNVVLRVNDVFADTLESPLFQGMRLELHDLGTHTAIERPPASEDSMFFRQGSLEAAASTFSMDLREDLEMSVAGRFWKLRFEADPPPLNAWMRPLPMMILLSGVIVSLLLFAILRALSVARTEAVGIALRATRELRGQLYFNAQLLEAIPYPVYFTDTEGNYLGCNRAFERELGVAREEIVGHDAFAILPAEIAEKLMADDQQLLEKGGVQTFELRAARPTDGAVRESIFSKSSFRNADGAIAGIVGVVVDITDRKDLEAANRESHEQLRAVVEAAPLALIVRDFDNIVRVWNPGAERLFGWKAEEIVGTATSIVPDGARSEVAGMRERAQAGESILIEETQRQHKDGSLIDVSLAITPLRDAAGAAYSTMVTITDIRPRKLAERALRESEERLRLAMDAAQMGLWYWDAARDEFTYSEGLNPIFGRARDAPYIGYREFQETLHADDLELIRATVRHALKHGEDFQLDYRVVWPDGTVHWVANRGQVHRAPNGRALRIVGLAMDITDRKHAEQRISHMAHHDALTGLPNRSLLHDRIRQAIAHAHRAHKQVAVMFIDLDRFKNINDSLGHAFGDRLLQAVASRILVCLREGDTVSRLGGDEFVIVIPGIDDAADASVVAGKVLEVLSAPFHLHGNDLHVSASVGISLYPPDGADAETLMRHADTAMYHAKDSGRGNYQYFTAHMNVAAHRRLMLENAMRRAIDNEEFELHYQPLYDLRDRSITGLEALLRWHPKGEPAVPPAQFIAAAEESGLIVPIGEWALRAALKQGKAWQAAGRPLLMAVNVSATQLARPNFVERLRRMLQETGLDPALLELEVTERVIVEGMGEARTNLDRVAALGVGIAIDDFGTGYSGLAYLKRFPIDTVKIDQSFIRDLTVDPDDAAIVTAIIAMAKSLGIDVVAEGVETEAQLNALKALGCQRAQGYFLAVPMPVEGIEELLAAPRSSAAAD